MSADGEGRRAAERARMVAEQVEARGVTDPLVLRAMGRVPRELFVPPASRGYAYEDTPLPIGEGQTISQPFVVALMVAALGLRGGERVLEVGTGCGYAAAVLAEVAGEVHTIERVPALAERAVRNLEAAGYDPERVRVHLGDGTLGVPEAAPFDGIVVAAGGPEPGRTLMGQLALGGRLVVPVGADLDSQTLLRITRTGAERYEVEDLGGVRFVPLIGREGWPEDGEGR